MRCDYCLDEATARIPSNPGDVCRSHAIEYWTSLLAYAKAQRTATPGFVASSAPVPAAVHRGVRAHRPAAIGRRSLHTPARVLTAY